MAFHDDDDDTDHRPPRRRRRVGDEDGEREHDFGKRDLPHSGLGVGSLVLAAVAVVSLLALFVIGALMHRSAALAPGKEPPVVYSMWWSIFGACALSLLGLGLGIGSLIRKRRRKLLGVVGVIANGLLFLGTSGLVCIAALTH
jgi:hypothetical protein